MEEQREGEIEIEDEPDQEVEAVKLSRDPGQPTAKEMEEHRCTHLPYRLWCKFCVMGRGRGMPHKHSSGSVIPIIGIDYFFITVNGVARKQEVDQAQDAGDEPDLESARATGTVVKCILARCSITKMLFAHVVPQKGVDEDMYVARLVSDDIAWLGHSKAIIKGDNEPALQALIRRVIDMSKAECKTIDSLSREESAPYDSQSNGSTETGVRLIRGLFRTTELCLEARVQKVIPVNHALVPWILEHAALLLNTMVRGQDGATPWARARGRPFRQQLVGIGESVLYKFPAKGPRSDPMGNMGPKWGEGIFLGYNRDSNTFVVSSDEGVVTTRTLSRKPLDQRWDADGLSAVKSAPGDGRDAPRPRVHFREPVDAPITHDVAAPAAPRALRIEQADVTEFGLTDGCPQCEYFRRYGRARPGTKHTATCRTRITAALNETEAGRERLNKLEERTNRAIAERIEHAHPRPEAPPARQVQGGDGGAAVDGGAVALEARARRTPPERETAPCSASS